MPAADRLPEYGVLSLLDAELDEAQMRRGAIPAAALLVLAWLAFVAARGGDTGAIVRLVPPDMLLGGVTTALALSVVVAASRGARPLAALATQLLAFVGGVLLTGPALRAVARLGMDGWSAVALERLAFGIAVAGPMLAAGFALRVPVGPFRLRFAAWSATTRLLTRGEKPTSWVEALGGLTITVGVPFFLVMQLFVGFVPIGSGALFPMVGPIVLLALVNAVVEESVFRGLVQPAVTGCAGPGPGLWLQGIFFGSYRFALGLTLLASIPAAIVFGVGGVLLGKSVIETRGMAWAVAAHAVLDIGVLAAFGFQVLGGGTGA